jgi:hypothetical protein
MYVALLGDKMFTLDNKEYDETKISTKAKAALEEVVRVSKHMQDLRFAQQGYINILKEELKETKDE